MEKSLLLTTILATTCLMMTYCQNKVKPVQTVEKNKHQGVDLIIDIKHFKGKLCQQKVSSVVYDNISKQETHRYTVEPEYLRQHSIISMKKRKM